MNLKNEREITIHFVHAACTPHNNFLLDSLARHERIKLFRHYLLKTTEVPGRPWKNLNSGLIQQHRIRTGLGSYWDSKLFRLAIFEKRSIFFVVGWDYPLLVVLIFLICIRRKGLIMWDDGPSDEALVKIKKWWNPKQLVKIILIKSINKNVSTYFCTGRKASADAISLGIDKSKIKLLPFFVSPGQFEMELRIKHNCINEDFMFVSGGRFIVDKGFDILIQSLAKFNKKYLLPWKLVLIGSGPEKNRIVSLIENFALSEKIDIIEWADPELFANYIRTSDIFIAPARFDFFPTTVISALQDGVAVLASDGVGSANEFIQSGQNGIIFPAQNENALSEALLYMVSDRERLKNIGERGKATMNLWPVERGVTEIINAANNI
jgi:glycosyltransferase involved in cell wall biosynthesis